MFALSEVIVGIGRPPAIPAASMFDAKISSPPLPLPLALTVWKLPASSVNERGADAGWSWNVLAKKKTCVPSWSRLASQEPLTRWFQTQPAAGQNPAGEGIAV